ncbi:MAG: hypothetical protein ABJ056_03860, partial [Halioglobus sp.]
TFRHILSQMGTPLLEVVVMTVRSFSLLVRRAFLISIPDRCSTLAAADYPRFLGQKSAADVESKAWALIPSNP